MRQPQPARAADGVLPLRQARDGRAQRADQSRRERDIRACRQLAPPVYGLCAIEYQRQSPRADGHIGEHGMERMTQPRSVEEVVELAPGAAAGEGFTCGALHDITRRLEPALLVNHIERVLQYHADLHLASQSGSFTTVDTAEAAGTREG